MRISGWRRPLPSLEADQRGQQQGLRFSWQRVFGSSLERAWACGLFLNSVRVVLLVHFGHQRQDGAHRIPPLVSHGRAPGLGGVWSARDCQGAAAAVVSPLTCRSVVKLSSRNSCVSTIPNLLSTGVTTKGCFQELAYIARCPFCLCQWWHKRRERQSVL